MAEEMSEATAPLTLNEARWAAELIRQSSVIDRNYWPWVIEELCKRIEELESERPVKEG